MSSETTKAESVETPIPNPPANAAWPVVQGQLRARAKSARRWSVVVLAFIVTVVVVGVFWIVRANLIVKGDYGAGFGTDNSDYWSTPYNNENASYTTEHFPNEGQAGKKSAQRDSKPNVEIEKLKRKVEADIGGLRSKVENLAPQIADAKSALADIKSHVDSVEGDFKTIKDEMEKLRHDLEKGSPRLEFLVTTFATRFGIAAIVLLLVKILTSIYRYHARLAAHFDSKADALELCPVGDVAVLEKLCLAFSTAGVDFHESADSIAEHAVDIARKVMPRSSI
jgi:hypothetical protein